MQSNKLFNIHFVRSERPELDFLTAGPYVGHTHLTVILSLLAIFACSRLHSESTQYSESWLFK